MGGFLQLGQPQGLLCPRGSMYPINQLLGIWVIVIRVQVLGKYMINGYLDPYGVVPFGEFGRNMTCDPQSTLHRRPWLDLLGGSGGLSK